MNAESLVGNPCRSSPVEYHRKRALAMPGCESRGESGAVELRSVCAVVLESVSVEEGRGRAVEGKIDRLIEFDQLFVPFSADFGRCGVCSFNLLGGNVRPLISEKISQCNMFV